MTLWWGDFRKSGWGGWKLVCKGSTSCLNDLLLWNVWNFLLQRTTKWNLAFRYSENSRLWATFIAYVEATHVLIKIKICKIYHILCLLWVNSQPWRAWVMLCGKGSWPYFSLVGQRWGIKVAGITLKVRVGSGHMYSCSSGPRDFLMCSCMIWDEKCLWQKKKERTGKNCFFWSALGLIGGGVKKKDKWYQNISLF